MGGEGETGRAARLLMLGETVPQGGAQAYSPQGWGAGGAA